MSMDNSTRRMAGRLGIGEQELMRCYDERLSDWSEPGAVKVYRDGKLLDPVIVLDGSPSPE